VVVVYGGVADGADDVVAVVVASTIVDVACSGT
jgi:hypothetical protein